MADPAAPRPVGHAADFRSEKIGELLVVGYHGVVVCCLEIGD